MPENRRSEAEVAEILATLRPTPMADWPQETFERIGLRNPYLPGNMTLRVEALEATRGRKGAVVECGTYRAEGIAPIALLLELWDDPRPVYGFDSFRGFPAVAAAHDAIDGAIPDTSRPSYFADTTLEDARSHVRRFGLDKRVTLVPGPFEETLPRSQTGPISVAILDCDLYSSYKVALEHLYPRVEPGGWIFFDEYYSRKYPGARVAIDEFFSDKPEKPTLAKHLLREHPFERWYAVKAP